MAVREQSEKFDQRIGNMLDDHFDDLSRASMKAHLSPKDHHLARQDGELSNADLITQKRSTEPPDAATPAKSKDFSPRTMSQAFLVACGSLAVNSSS